MADLQGFPFESIFTGEDAMGNPIFDRAIDSVTYRAFWKKYFSNGVFFEPATNFQVSSIGGLDVEVLYGEAHVEGLTVLPGDNVAVQLTLDNALTTGDRTDIIALKVDFSAERTVSVVKLTGASAVSDLQRDESAWELGLAKILVRRDATHINQADITDLRLSTDWCGIVTEPFTRTNTNEFFVQMMQSIENHEAEWKTFYDGISEDISVLLEYATIRIDQVAGLQAKLAEIPGQLAAQDAKIQGQLAAQDATMTQNFAAQDARVNAALNVKQNELLPTVVLLPQTGWAAIPSPTQESDQFAQTVSVAGWLAKDDFFCSHVPEYRTAFNEASIAALDTTTDGKITFVCTEKPPVGVDIYVRLMKIEVNTHG